LRAPATIEIDRTPTFGSLPQGVRDHLRGARSREMAFGYSRRRSRRPVQWSRQHRERAPSGADPRRYL